MNCTEILVNVSHRVKLAILKLFYMYTRVKQIGKQIVLNAEAKFLSEKDATNKQRGED